MFYIFLFLVYDVISKKVFINRTCVLKGMMSLNDFEELYPVLQEMRQEKETLQKQIDDNLIKIKEADYYIQSILEKEDKDFKVFSPRDMESLHKEEIEKMKAEQSSCEQQLTLLYSKYDRIASHIEKLEKVLRRQEEYNVNSHTCQRNLTVLNIQEQDRQRIARDLHDTSLQNLAHLVHKIELSTMFVDQDPVRAKLELAVIKKNLKAIIDEIRNTIYNMRPMTFDDLGLKTALERLIAVINVNMEYQIDMDIEDVSCENNLVAVTVYRVVQECFLNITKHAKADKIFFRCKQSDNMFIIDIEDNGKGFSCEEADNVDEKHFGISIMKERVSLLGGTIKIHSKLNHGTKVHIEVPF